MLKIYLNYGPYECCGIVKHRPERLRGLVQALREDGEIVKLVPWEHWDRLGIVIAGRLVFECRLTFLSFQPGCNDTTAKVALQAIREAMSRIQPQILPSEEKSPYD